MADEDIVESVEVADAEPGAVEEQAEAKPEKKGRKAKKGKKLKDAVTLYHGSYDEEHDEIRIQVTHMERSQLPRDALRVDGGSGFSGKSKAYFTHSFDLPEVSQLQEDGTPCMGAADLYNYCKLNCMQDGFNIKSTTKLNSIDVRKVMIWLFIGVAAICVLYAML